MIVVTGGAGFIGSALVWRLNQEGINDIIIVDNFGQGEKWRNIAKRRFHLALHRDEFLEWLKVNGRSLPLSIVFHLGACSSTAEKDMDYLLRNNVHYGMELFNFCRTMSIPFIYASSAATYGGGEQGYSDNHAIAHTLHPINPYGFSKKLFDSWVLEQNQAPPFWAGLKFFNVFGPNEYHKGSMRSLVCKALPQIRGEGQLRLFKSHKVGIADGEQKRDFVYVKDVVDVMMHLWRAGTAKPGSVQSGLYNVGTGEARSFADLGRAVFRALNKTPAFAWIDMPESIRQGYQYFTQADLERLRNEGGYRAAFTSLEAAVADYVTNYLIQEDPYL